MKTTGFNWDGSGPCADALAAFGRVTDDKTEFPHSYSGQAWRAAYRLWLAIKGKPIREQNEQTKDGFHYDPAWNWNGEDGGEDLGLSGFMAGWAMNAVRQMLRLKAINNPAIVTVGQEEQPPMPSVGPAERMMKRVIGGIDPSGN